MVGLTGRYHCGCGCGCWDSALWPASFPGPPLDFASYSEPLQDFAGLEKKGNIPLSQP